MLIDLFEQAAVIRDIVDWNKGCAGSAASWDFDEFAIESDRVSAFIQLLEKSHIGRHQS